MSSLLHPTVPSFYACYLLRSYPTSSTSSTSSTTTSSIPTPSPKTYIGSTPSPPRRLRQHNGSLSAGAFRTRTGRPWEMDLLVWGFSSKIAALQFEWAWQMPHLSRHLKEVQGGRGIWRSATKRGRFSPGSQVLILRSLLRSEPFCHWGLRVTCLAEWSWKAWRRLEEEEEARAGPSERRRGRQTGRVMPPTNLSPAVRCDFTGVSGKRKPLTAYSEEERRGMGLRDVPVVASTSTSKGKGKGKAQDKPDGRSKSTTTSWHETLPTGATARGMGATWHELEHEVPVVPSVVPTEEQAEEQAERTWPPRFATDDADFTFLALQRLNRFCTHHKLKPQDLIPTPSPPPSSSRLPPSIQCSSCHTPINVQDPLSWTLCPSPFHALTPRSLDEAEYEPVPTLGNEERLGHSHCASAFHLTCLAQRWLRDEEGQRHKTEVLPLAGRCPTCSSSSSSSSSHPSHASSSSSPGLWADVVRSMHRRKEWLESGPGSLDFSLLGRVVGKARKRKRVLEDERVELGSGDEEEGEGREGSESDEEGCEGEENESVASGESDGGSSDVEVEMVVESPVKGKRKVGRPKGSKNKEQDKAAPSPQRKKGATTAAAAAARGRPVSVSKASSPRKKAASPKRAASSKKASAATTTPTAQHPPPQASSSLIASLDDMFG